MSLLARTGLAAALALLVAAPALAQRTSFEIVVGPAFNQLGNQSELRVLGQTIPGLSADYPTAVGVAGTLRGRVRLGPVGLRTGVGALATGTVFDVTTSILGRDDLSLEFLTAHLEAEVGTRVTGGDLHVFAGPELRVLLARDDEGPLDLGDVDRYQTALNLGIGGRLKVGPLLIGPEAKLALGLATFSDDTFTLGSIPVELDEGFTLDNLTVGLAVGLGG